MPRTESPGGADTRTYYSNRNTPAPVSGAGVTQGVIGGTTYTLTYDADCEAPRSEAEWGTA